MCSYGKISNGYKFLTEGRRDLKPQFLRHNSVTSFPVVPSFSLHQLQSYMHFLYKKWLYLPNGRVEPEVGGTNRKLVPNNGGVGPSVISLGPSYLDLFHKVSFCIFHSNLMTKCDVTNVMSQFNNT